MQVTYPLGKPDAETQPVEQKPPVIRYLPTWDRVLIQRHPDRDKTQRGLFLPQTFQGALAEGTIVAVGPGRLSDSGAMLPGPFNVGDVVLFSDQSALCVDPDDSEQVMVASQAILAVEVK